MSLPSRALRQINKIQKAASASYIQFPESSAILIVSALLTTASQSSTVMSD